MKMQDLVPKRTAWSAIAIWCFCALSIRGWTQGIPSESVTLIRPTQSLPTFSTPFFHEGTLFLAQITRPVENTVTAPQASRQTIAMNVARLADVNSLTGTYLYQTNDEGRNEGPEHVTTWLGDSNRKPTRVYVGAGYVKLSPGGTYVAATDKDGILRIIDRQGSERAVLGKGNNAIFSPDGTKLAFFKTVPFSISDAGGIAVVDLASGRTLATYDPDGTPYIPLAFEEDGNTLYFTANNPAALQTGDPSDENRVDVYALSLTENAPPRLITTGANKLPYIQYGRTEFLSELHLLVLSAEDKMWSVNTQTGAIRVFTDIVDIFRVDSSHLLVRRQANTATEQLWNVISIN